MQVPREELRHNWSPWPAINVSAADMGLLGECSAGLDGLSVPVGEAAGTFGKTLMHAGKKRFESLHDCRMLSPCINISEAIALLPFPAEDAGLSAYSIHLGGAPRVWYVIHPEAYEQFIEYLKGKIMGKLTPHEREAYKPEQAAVLLAVSHMLFPDFLTADDMRRFRISRVVQQPSDVVVTAPVSFEFN